MSDPLLIPATPALLEGWTGPACIPIRPGAHRCVVVVDGVPYEGAVETRAAVWLDLRRAEVRDRCARVVTETLYVQGSPYRDGVNWGGLMGASDCWSLFVGAKPVLFRHAPDSRYFDPPVVVRALAEIDPTDTTRLPDGSRRVDALALAAVVRQVVCDV